MAKMSELAVADEMNNLMLDRWNPRPAISQIDGLCLV
jgi:hypothetical protein